MKNKRQNLIVDIISKYEIDTQSELIEHLRTAGYDVTQATVSRDIRELKLIKVSTGRGSFRYMLPSQNTAINNVRFNNALVDSIISVDYTGNIIVLKTYPGLANAVATGIDSQRLSEILGSVAGDDTIIVVSRDEASACDISERLRSIIGS